jgi:hypothetical protein
LDQNNKVFRNLSLEHRRNAVVYLMSLVMTTLALVLQLASIGILTGKYHLWQVHCLRASGVVVTSVYIFELVYRVKMRATM